MIRTTTPRSHHWIAPSPGAMRNAPRADRFSPPPLTRTRSTPAQNPVAAKPRYTMTTLRWLRRIEDVTAALFGWSAGMGINALHVHSTSGNTLSQPLILLAAGGAAAVGMMFAGILWNLPKLRQQLRQSLGAAYQRPTRWETYRPYAVALAGFAATVAAIAAGILPGSYFLPAMFVFLAADRAAGMRREERQPRY